MIMAVEPRKDTRLTAATIAVNHLAQAKIHFEDGERHSTQAHEKYLLAADEIIRAMELDPRLSYRKIAKALGVDHSTVSRLLKWKKSGAGRTTPWETQEIKVARAIRQGIREQPETVVKEVLKSLELSHRIASVFVEGGSGEKAPPEFKPLKPKPKRPEIPAVLHPFDVVKLGDHALICGDSRIVRVALGGVISGTPRLFITDPPYGIGFKGFNDTTANWQKAWENFPGDHGFVFYEPTKADEVIAGLRAADFEVKKGLTWVKGTSPEYFRNYGVRRQDESIYRVERKGTKDHWVRGRQLVSPLWHFITPKERADSEGHTTPKPVALLDLLIRSASKEGDVVIDPFVGSGSTILAAEKTKRRCLAIELEPKWCDVAVRRWQRLTRKQALVWQQGYGRRPIPFDQLERDPSLYDPTYANHLRDKLLNKSKPNNSSTPESSLVPTDGVSDRAAQVSESVE
jgi:DNA modification methylase